MFCGLVGRGSGEEIAWVRFGGCGGNGVLDKAILKDGKRQTEAPAPRPAAQALRKATLGGGKENDK